MPFTSGSGMTIPPTVGYILNNGTRFLDTVMRHECKPAGLFRLSKLYLREVQVLVFNYNGEHTFKINIIDLSMNKGLQSAETGEDGIYVISFVLFL